MGEHPGSVVLVVRSPNFADSDLSVSAFWAWDVLRVKQAIAEACPGHPDPSEQRLVYAGKLLQDWQTLEQVLRFDEHALNYTLHMVCRPPVPIQTSPIPLVTDVESREAAVSTSPRRSLDTPTVPMPGVEASVPPVPPHAWSELFQEQMHALQSHNPSADQMIWWQTVCTQYMNQYMHYMQVTGAAPTSFPTPTWPPGNAQAPLTGPHNPFFPHMEPAAGQPHPPTEGHLAGHAGGAGLPGPAPGGADMPQAAPEVANAGPGGAIGAVANNDEGLGQRDALDWLDLATRAIVMFSLIYGYSSPSRILIVMIFAVLAYLWNVGFFRPRALPMAPINAQPDDIVPPQVDPNNEEAEAGTEVVNDEAIITNATEDPPRQANPESNVEGDESGSPPEENDLELTESPDHLATAYTFLSTFFTSLLPEQYQDA
ncbi:hypothetical protein TCAL_02113 [Tigriopus californicus]|uniref:Ubiquitin-like domain-containing protein n=1 Tax=Tigriopus californicus TaxID=6832 RepID=A0A553N9U9_TIGCA|nr:homocysteine-responsive endoplasmic reticulum-resident ubiquitin-like domain member 1 protein [Tigriopus californicus]TRY62197.1 hypothetical protein TCAL_02113 [Tigriopus californicus]